MEKQSNVQLASHSCVLGDLLEPFSLEGLSRGLDLQAGWARRWTVGLRLEHGVVESAVANLGSAPLDRANPWRRFTWRAGQRHRPGLEFSVSTGKHHGFESLEEQKLLLALDFLGGLVSIRSQPLRLRFGHQGGRGEHVPDYLATFRDGSRWLFDVRPRALVADEDALRFAAAAEVALACGWPYTVVTQWRRGVTGTIDTFSAQRRPLEDRLSLESELLLGAAEPGVTFGQLVSGTAVPAMARAHALHLLWHRELGTDLALPFGDNSPVWGRHR